MKTGGEGGSQSGEQSFSSWSMTRRRRRHARTEDWRLVHSLVSLSSRRQQRPSSSPCDCHRLPYHAGLSTKHGKGRRSRRRRSSVSLVLGLLFIKRKSILLPLLSRYSSDLIFSLSPFFPLSSRRYMPHSPAPCRSCSPSPPVQILFSLPPLPGLLLSPLLAVLHLPPSSPWISFPPPPPPLAQTKQE